MQDALCLFRSVFIANDLPAAGQPATRSPHAAVTCRRSHTETSPGRHGSAGSDICRENRAVSSRLSSSSPLTSGTARWKPCARIPSTGSRRRSSGGEAIRCRNGSGGGDLHLRANEGTGEEEQKLGEESEEARRRGRDEEAVQRGTCMYHDCCSCALSRNVC
eukprot:767933-Hanusia_phi.AAC.2